MQHYPFRCIFFDLNGVVLNDTQAHQKVWKEFFLKHGVLPSDNNISRTNGRRAYDVIIEICGVQPDGFRCHELMEEFTDTYQAYLLDADLIGVAGIKNFLTNLAMCGVQKVLTTSETIVNAKLVLMKLGLQSLFDKLVTAEDVDKGKPDPSVYEAALSRSGTYKNNCLVVEDSIAGIRAAKAAGIKCLGLTTSLSEDELVSAGADWIAGDFLSLPKNLAIHH